MGTIHGFWASNHASATCPGVACLRSAMPCSTTTNAWFAARPSGTEDVYKIYAESFAGPAHLRQVQDAAREVVGAALGA